MNISEYKYKIDTHCHTKPVSPCGEILPEELIKGYKETGADAVVITNHFFRSILPPTKEEAVKYWLSDFYKTLDAGEKYGIKVILGMEIRFPQNQNDYLVYGIDEEFVKKAYDYVATDLETFYKTLKDDKNVILQAHPFRNNMELADPSFLDGIEVFNMHPGHNSRVALAYRYAQKHEDFIITAGTDFHHKGHQGMGFLLAKTLPSDSFSFAEILKSKDYLMLLGGCIVIPYSPEKKIWQY